MSQQLDLFHRVGQRWRDGRDSYRPPDDERFEPRHHDVALVETEEVVRPFVTGHHYSGSLPNSGRFRFLLIDTRRPSWSADGVVGVAVFGSPGGPTVLSSSFPFLASPSQEACELQRLVLLDEVRRNGESWFVAQCLRKHPCSIARAGVEAVVSFSDPVARFDAEGCQTMPGHVGCVYQALSALYTGRTRRRCVWRLRSTGQELSERDLTKIRAACPCCGSGKSCDGAQGAVERLLALGASTPAGCLRAWLQVALEGIADRVPHPGKHRYTWGLARSARRELVRLHSGRSYPKAGQS